MINYHQAVMLDECIRGLNIKPDGIYVDTTFGGGGHSREILKHLKSGKLVAFDQDEDALQNIPADERLIFVRHNFKFLKNFLRYYRIDKIDGLLADLGVSSHHFDSPERGFSFRFHSAIDMRMNQSSDLSAKDILNTYPEEELAHILWEYGELKNSRRIARSISKYRADKPIDETRDLLQALEPHMPRQGQNQFLAKVYQALRIEVNCEIENLKEMLTQSLDMMNPGARLVVMSYHSIEDRVVKNFMKNGSFKEDSTIDLYGNKPPVFRLINKKVITPGDDELKTNNRARSAKLRIAEKV